MIWYINKLWLRLGHQKYGIVVCGFSLNCVAKTFETLLNCSSEKWLRDSIKYPTRHQRRQSWPVIQLMICSVGENIDTTGGGMTPVCYTNFLSQLTNKSLIHAQFKDANDWFLDQLNLSCLVVIWDSSTANHVTINFQLLEMACIIIDHDRWTWGVPVIFIIKFVNFRNFCAPASFLNTQFYNLLRTTSFESSIPWPEFSVPIYIDIIEYLLEIYIIAIHHWSKSRICNICINNWRFSSW